MLAQEGVDSNKWGPTIECQIWQVMFLRMMVNVWYLGLQVTKHKTAIMS